MATYVPKPVSAPRSAAELIEELGSEIAARYAAAETVMIERVARAAARGIDNPDLAARAKVLRELRIEGGRIANDLADPEAVRRFIAIAAAEGQSAALETLRLDGGVGRLLTTSGVTTNSARATAQIALDLSNDLDNMSARITRWMPDVYQRVISMVTPNTILGVETLLQSQRRAAEAFIARGVTGFVDKAGKKWRIGTYAEMAARTSVNRAWQESNIFALGQRADVHLVTIVLGSDACNKCAQHAGRIYSTDGLAGGNYTLEHSTQPGRQVRVSVAGPLDQARANGWNHPNCRCVVVAYLPGLSIAQGSSTYSPKAEKDRDRLRALERRVRDLKRRQAATFDDVTKARIGRKIRSAQGDIREHVATTGQLRKNYREQLHFSDGRPAPLAPRPVAITPPPPRPVAPPVSLPVTPPTPPRVVPPPRIPPTPTAPSANEIRQQIYQARYQTGLDARAAAAAKAVEDEARRVAGIARRRLLSPEEVARAANQARGAVNAAESSAAVGKVLKTHLADREVEIVGFGGAKVTLKSARDIAIAAIDMFETYPGAFVNKIEIRRLGLGTIAQAQRISTRVNGVSRYTSARIQVNSLYTSDDLDFDRMMRSNMDAGHFHEYNDTSLRGTMIHEFGHTIDYVGQLRTRARIADINRAYVNEQANGKVRVEEILRGQLSGYGQSKVAEQIAEAFADVHMNGTRAKELNRRVYAAMIEEYEKDRYL